MFLHPQLLFCVRVPWGPQIQGSLLLRAWSLFQLGLDQVPVQPYTSRTFLAYTACLKVMLWLIQSQKLALEVGCDCPLVCSLEVLQESFLEHSDCLQQLTCHKHVLDVCADNHPVLV